MKERVPVRFAITIIAAILLVIISAVAFWRLQKGVRAFPARLAEIERALASLEDSYDAVQAYEEFRRASPAALARINNFFVSKDRPIAFIEALEGAAAASGSALSLEIDERGSREGTLLFRATITGSESSVRDALRRIETLPFHARAETLLFEALPASGPNAASARMQVSIRVKTF